MTWQWQLDGKVDTGVNADVFDIDAVDNDASVVSALHAKGKKVICYVDVGGVEQGRPDSGAFPKAVQGNTIEGWRDERWVDVRQLSTLEPIFAKRFQTCKDKGFDAIEADQVEAYKEKSGFPLSQADQVAFNRMLARLAHERGLSIGLKNALALIPQLVGEYDFAVNEQCAEFDECDKLSPFINAGKAVFHAEYDVPTSKFCPTSRRLKLSSIKKELDLNATRETC
ncbi:endo alpha-1,4 polygalactosaminidase [Pseudonocardiaceae bacterium YIM PH 21723]|nr:endo alpha-1,4 polygalactosaminidase [Pseudonocardiaceae bacterium YIM PH 21723]